MTEVLQSLAVFFTGMPWLPLLLGACAGTAGSLPLADRLRLGGWLLPGLGLLAGFGLLPPWPLSAAAFTGALCGAGLAYGMGRRHGGAPADAWPFSGNRHRLAEGRRRFGAQGARALLVAGMRPGLRGPVAAAAGTAGMPVPRFAVLAVASSLFWTAFHLLPAFAAGLALAVLGSYSKRLAFAVLLLAIMLAAAGWLGLATLRFGLRVLPRLQARLIAWAAHRDSRLQAVVARLAAPHHAEFRLFLVLNLILFGMIFGFLAVLAGIATGEPLFRFDTGVSRFLQGLRTPLLDQVMIFLTSLGDWAVTLPVALAAGAALLLARRWRLTIGLALAIASTMAFVQGVKLLIQAPRPIAIYDGPDAFSFPSGHATLTATLYGILALLAFRFAAPLLRRGSVAICAGLIGAICFSRVYLAAHWPSDVIAGLMYGAAVTAAFALVFRREELSRRAAHGLLAGCALTLLLLGGWHAAGRLPAAQAFYAAQEADPLRLSAGWRAGGWRELPQHRTDLSGENEEPLLLQWAGSAGALRDALRAQGWREPPGWSLAAADGLVHPGTAALDLPVLPMLDQGRRPAVTMLRAAVIHGTAGRFVLRAWPQRIAGPAGGAARQLLLGSLVFEALRQPLGQFSIAVPREGAACDGDALLLPLPGAQPVGARLPGEDAGCGGRRVLAGPGGAGPGQPRDQP